MTLERHLKGTWLQTHLLEPGACPPAICSETGIPSSRLLQLQSLTLGWVGEGPSGTPRPKSQNCL